MSDIGDMIEGTSAVNLHEENIKLRRLLAIAYSGASLYGDDGELQDNRTLPFIDYVRMTAEQIEEAFHKRAAFAYVSKNPLGG